MARPAKSMRHLKVLEFIVMFKQEHDGLSPTVRELATEFHTSTSVIAYYLNLLRASGAIEYLDGLKARSIMVVGGKWELQNR